MDKLSNLSFGHQIEIIQFLRKDITKWASELRKNILIISFSSKFPRCIVQKLTHLYGCLSWSGLGDVCWRWCLLGGNNQEQINHHLPNMMSAQGESSAATHIWECHTLPPWRIQRNPVAKAKEAECRKLAT